MYLFKSCFRGDGGTSQEKKEKWIKYNPDLKSETYHVWIDLDDVKRMD